MTVQGEELRFADPGEAADLAAFLARLIHYDRAAAVRLQAGGGVLAVFGRPPSFEVLAIRTARLAADTVLDTTVSAGQFADALDTAARRRAGGADAAPPGPAAAPAGLDVAVPDPVTGPPWAGLLPPRGGWHRVPGLPGAAEVRGAVASAVAEFRARDAALPEERRTRAERDRIGREIWSRTLGETGLPLRAVHAAQSLGFLRPARTPEPVAAAVASGSQGGGSTAPAPEPEQLALLAAGGWLRLRTPYGSIALRKTGLPGLSGLSVTPA
ncbi:hypothetical protein SBI_07058 [Streptomyces bingchenggensis BCW-1]|uniref:Uncharacterized protein n=1 Tax=Streptomyces bingchenggensis (strain BCW-1) TaxID=749414 RepID=D7C3F3_STRBB|nr:MULTISPECIES: hypothetical protein [Streptomyces]ADI10178.1 hypothetical protein SBI_07058 [Streptomyces bingchenggensis BCW-1]